MKKALIVLVATISFFSCEDPPSNNGEGNFRAYCQQNFPLGSHTPLGWCGPKRKTKEEAVKDMENHEKEFNHKTYECGSPCPTCDKMDAQ